MLSVSVCDTSGWQSLKWAGKLLINSLPSLANRQHTARVKWPWLYRYPGKKPVRNLSENFHNLFKEVLSLCAYTQGDGLKIHRVHEMAKQSPLQAQHIPAQDLVTTAHGSETLAVLNAVPSGHDGTRLHWDGSLTWDREESTQHYGTE